MYSVHVIWFSLHMGMDSRCTLFAVHMLQGSCCGLVSTCSCTCIGYGGVLTCSAWGGLLCTDIGHHCAGKKNTRSSMLVVLVESLKKKKNSLTTRGNPADL